MTNTDEADARLGRELAQVLAMKRDKEHPDRWQTAWGSKTDAGLSRTIRNLITQFDEQNKVQS